MEYCLPQLLSRDEIVRILIERQLQIANVATLSHAELLTIYTTFAVPLPKRDSKVNHSTRSNGAPLISMPTDLTSQRCAAKRHSTMDVNNVHLESLNINDESVLPKRTKISDKNLLFKKDHLADNTNAYSSIAKKRKIITWP